ncbi:helix-turn-helix domain-containing protein [Acinetobacter ursingii]|uniref:helix-turn-helix domain-containing protein n=1 Tax=Acinetobacter ursingii TaxID=108980 RepID=UPI0021CD70CD|nr:helix-turn-helix domain-containing protein [Acinetobacter ursingii]MCU4601882.1 MarR family transcriptional regulator [Acinetobacter ursingii]
MTTENKSAGIVLEVLKALRGRSLSGATNQELSKQIGTSPATITRALKTLEQHGFAQKLDDGSYAQGKFFIQAAYAHAEEIDRAQGRINQHIQQVFAGVRQINSGAA